MARDKAWLSSVRRGEVLVIVSGLLLGSGLWLLKSWAKPANTGTSEPAAAGHSPTIFDRVTAQVPQTARACLLENGLAYSPFRDGQSPNNGIYPTVAQIEEDLTVLSHITRRIRTYSAVGVMAEIPRLARKLNMRVSLGVHLSRDVRANDTEMDSALGLARDGLADSIIVGNETLTSNSVPKPQLIAAIRRVKASAPPGVRVSTAEVGPVWRENLDLAKEVDYVVAHFYPFWEKHAVDGAAAQVLEHHRDLTALLKREYPQRDIPVVIGETGWPSGGEPIAKGVTPGPQQQRRFFEEFVATACGNSVPFYYFSAFDEEWKWREGMSGGRDGVSLPPNRIFSGRWVGSSWGLLQSNGKLKPQFAELLDPPAAGTRAVRDVFVDGTLGAYYGIGLDTSRAQRDWLATPREALRMMYPAQQEWGTVFITVGPPSPRPRPWKDFSEFRVLSLDLRGEKGGESLEVGLKDYNDPDDGRELKIPIANLTTKYQAYDIPLAKFASSRLVIPDDLERLYVVVEFVFGGRQPQTVFVRNVRFKP